MLSAMSAEADSLRKEGDPLRLTILPLHRPAVQTHGQNCSTVAGPVGGSWLSRHPQQHLQQIPASNEKFPTGSRDQPGTSCRTENSQSR